MALTPKEKKFVAHYCVHFNGAAAVRHAGYDTVAPAQMAVALLTKVHIQERVNKVIDGLGELHFKLADEVTAALRAMKDADRTAIYNEDGTLKHPRDWPDACKALLAGVEVNELVIGENVVGQTKKVKLEAPKGILDSIAKITGQWIERSQFLDRHGRPTDPPAPSAAIIEVTVGLPPKKGNGHAT